MKYPVRAKRKKVTRSKKLTSLACSVVFMYMGLLLLLGTGWKTGTVGTVKTFFGDIFPIAVIVCFLLSYMFWHGRTRLAVWTLLALPALALGAPFFGMNGGFFNFGFRAVKFLSGHPVIIGIPAILTVVAIAIGTFKRSWIIFQRSWIIFQNSEGLAAGLPQIAAAESPSYPRAVEFGFDVDYRPRETSIISTTDVSQAIPTDLRERIAKYEWAGEVGLKDIYGYVRFIENMKADIERHMTDRERASRYVREHALNAYLLYGTGGTGKSHVARCFAGYLARDYGFLVFDVKNCHQLQGSNWQASLKALTEFLETVKVCRANGFRVAIVWDELDGYCASNLPSDAKRVAAMKTAFDEWGRQEGAPMIVLATTNEPQEFSEEMLRPGRLKPVYFPPPDLEARGAIIREHLKGKNLLAGDREEIIRWIALQSEDATVSELLAYLDNIGMTVYEKARETSRDIPIRLQDFQRNKMCVRDYDVFQKKMKRKFSGRHSHKIALFSEMTDPIKECLKYSEQNIQH